MMNLFQKVTERLSPEKNFDVYTRRIKVSFGWIDLVFLSSLIDTQLVLEAVQSIKKVKNQLILDQRLNVPQIQEEKDVDLLLTCFYNGELLIFYKDKAFHADCKKLPVRGIDEPYSEKAIRGSRDGFNENLNTNIALIRLRLKSEKLHADLFTVSEYGKTAVCLVYLEDKANPEIVRELERRIRNLHIHSLIMTDRSLEEKLFRQGKIIYPLVRYTERPDVASIHIMNGKIVILVDTSSSALITPICLLDHLKHVEEFRQSPFIGSFTKFLRILSILVSLFLSPTVLALYIDHDFAHFFSSGYDFTGGRSRLSDARGNDDSGNFPHRRRPHADAASRSDQPRLRVGFGAGQHRIRNLFQRNAFGRLHQRHLRICHAELRIVFVQ